ncbi:serine/threonine-protein kinase [Peribacillus simplex]|uniref:protein kinase domain-containing protein n=1 Tax=Peribacillus simplex TaxID=1478 RepID=UPI0028163960|nr:protein kinase family protein [Peribacillus simplex]MDF9758539.1 serine/threonine-protein kinase [Peribacillus simplex]
MMMNNTLRNQCNLLPGGLVTGKWNKNEYKIIKELGCGANGIVYLVESENRHYALKLSDNGTSIISEMNILKSFSKVQGSTLGPSFLEADDFIKAGKQLPFYVMEYIHGHDFLRFIEKKGPSWIGVLMLQLLTSLSALHTNGWVFGDLKPENLIVTSPAYKVRCVDVGGTTLIGRSVKEFTEFFDRGYWGLGSRKADPQYDLFAVAMIIINSSYPKRFHKNGEGYKQLNDLIKQKKELHPYRKMLDKALRGQYDSALQMREDLVTVLSKQNHLNKKGPGQAATRQPSTNQPATRQARRSQNHSNNKSGGFFETFLLVAIISMLYVLYIYEQLL